MINEEYSNRLNTLRYFIQLFQNDFGNDFSAAVCGSVGIANPSEKSDIDFYIAIQPERIRDAIQTPIFQKVFNGIPKEEVFNLFEDGELLGIRPIDNYFGKYKLSMNIFSVHLFTQLSQMYYFPVIKYRFELPSQQVQNYRNFGYQAGNDTIPVPVRINPFGDGAITTVSSMIFHRGEPYFHINADKFLTSYFLHDKLNLFIAHQSFLFRLFEEFLNTAHDNPFGFLYAFQKIAPWRLKEILLAIPEKLKSRAIPKNLGMPAKRQQQLHNIEANAKKIVVISGPGGIGKDTVARAVLQHLDNAVLLKPETTRLQRNLQEQQTYSFVTVSEFIKQRNEGEFFYWQYNGVNRIQQPDYYAVSFERLINLLQQYNTVLITVGGTGFASFLKRLFPDSTAICLLPESKQQLLQQLENRGLNNREEQRKKLTQSVFDMQNQEIYDYCIINRFMALDSTIKQVMKAITCK